MAQLETAQEHIALIRENYLNLGSGLKPTRREYDQIRRAKAYQAYWNTIVVPQASLLNTAASWVSESEPEIAQKFVYASLGLQAMGRHAFYLTEASGEHFAEQIVSSHETPAGREKIAFIKRTYDSIDALRAALPMLAPYSDLFASIVLFKLRYPINTEYFKLVSEYLNDKTSYDNCSLMLLPRGIAVAMKHITRHPGQRMEVLNYQFTPEYAEHTLLQGSWFRMTYLYWVLQEHVMKRTIRKLP